MNEGNVYYEGFMRVLQKKIPHKATLANTITDILAIDKDAVYRRLRGEVNFSFAEIAIIAKNLGISIDKIAGIENIQSKPSTINISRQVNPTEYDYEMFEGHVNLLKSIKNEPDTKIMEIGNAISHYLYQDYEYITRFNLFRWNLASSYGDARPFHKIIIPERLRILQKETCKYARYISSTLYMWDPSIFQRYVTSIKYCDRVRLIREEDIALIKNDLMDFLNAIENLAIKGKHEETGNEVSFFISDLPFDSNYSCIESKNIHLTLFRAFLLNASVTFDEEVFNEVLSWMRTVQRMSTLISVSGEKIRTAFFDAQRKIIDTI